MLHRNIELQFNNPVVSTGLAWIRYDCPSLDIDCVSTSAASLASTISVGQAGRILERTSLGYAAASYTSACSTPRAV